MVHEFLTWGNLATWAFCAILIYVSLNFRLYMIFHHPGRKLKAKARARKEKCRLYDKKDGEWVLDGVPEECRPL